ncbi:MAG: DNA (cytosine-5-)-methyltransferase [Saprospiraceae bacterium]
MIGKKVDIKAYQEAGRIKKQNAPVIEETLLTHYNTLSQTNKKIVKSFFKDSIKPLNGFKDMNLEDAIQQYLFELKAEIPFPGPEAGTEKFTFIDLFAGIGGFRLALQNLGGRCVFSSEWDKYSKQTYKANFGEIPFGDITSDETKSFIPKKFDILCGGFPCQPFSIAGVSKKNSLGRKHGFDDIKQGNLFFHVADIIAEHRPKAFFLENVKNLVSHDKGNTFKIIRETLEGLGYSFDRKILDGKYFVPQHRERTIMIGFDKNRFGKNISFDFKKVLLPEANHKIKDILDKKVDLKYTLSEHLWNYLQNYAKKHKEKGNGFGFGLVDLNGISRTMSARYYKDGSEILIPQKNNIPRRITPKEAASLFGYPNEFKIPDSVSDTQAYRQFGNSVVMPLIESVGKLLVNNLLNHV